MKAFLQQLAPEIFEKWQSLSKLFEEQTEKNSDFLQKPAVQISLNEIRRAIEERFNQAAKATHESRPFAKQLNDWLEEIKNKSSYLAVRSSSDEDKNELSNAGANLTESYVEPELSNVLESCGRVIASYFNPTSLKNRLDVNENPFNDLPQLSVVIQELIGETVENQDSDQIPVSLVLFSNEPDYTEDGFRITKISASYGHGEGVVNNDKINCDTVFVLKSRRDATASLSIYQNHEKKLRLAPRGDQDGTVKLRPVKNPNPLQRCLDEKMIQRLFDFAAIMEKENGFPTDMEIIIKNGIIHVVQARRIIRQKALPTYLDDSKTVPLMSAQVIVPGKSNVEQIQSKDEILVCKTLAEADVLFKKGQHKLVIVGEMENAENSHPVVNFSARAIPCFFFPDLEKIQQLCAKVTAEQPLIACSQSQRFGLWDHSISLKEHIKEGFFSHPANINPSLDGQEALVFPPEIKETIPAEVEQAIRSLKEASTNEIALQALAQLKQNPLVTNLKTRITQLKALEKEHPKVRHTIQAFKNLKKQIKITTEELEKSLTDQAPRLEKLFHIKTLESLISSSKTDSVNSFSLLHVNPLATTIEKTIDYRKKLPFESQLSDLFSIGTDAFISLDQENPWEKFLIELEHGIHEGTISPDEIKKFRSVIQVAKDFDGLTSWANIICLPIFGETKNAVETCKRILAEEKLDAHYLELLNRGFETIKEIKKSLPDFGRKDKLESSWEKIKNLMRFVSNQSDLLNAFNQQSMLGKLTLTELLKQFTELTDEAIKEMKKSSEFTDEEKVFHLLNMLKDNSAVLMTWATSKISTFTEEKLNNYQAYLNVSLNIVSARHSLLKMLPSFLATNKEASVDHISANCCELLKIWIKSFSFDFPDSANFTNLGIYYLLNDTKKLMKTLSLNSLSMQIMNQHVAELSDLMGASGNAESCVGVLDMIRQEGISPKNINGVVQMSAEEENIPDEEKIAGAMTALLYPTAGASVAATIITSDALLPRHFPESAETLFSTIHQSQLAIIASLFQKVSSNKLLMHPNCSAFTKEVVQSIENQIKPLPELNGAYVTKNSLKFSYNVPLRLHAATIEIEQKLDNSIHLTTKIFGYRRDKWQKLGAYLQALKSINESPIEHCKVDGDELTVSFKIEKSGDLNKAISDIKFGFAYTNQNDNGKLESDLFDNASARGAESLKLIAISFLSEKQHIPSFKFFQVLQPDDLKRFKEAHAKSDDPQTLNQELAGLLKFYEANRGVSEVRLLVIDLITRYANKPVDQKLLSQIIAKTLTADTNYNSSMLNAENAFKRFY